jgi:hypothetical protein
LHCSSRNEISPFAENHSALPPLEVHRFFAFSFQASENMDACARAALAALRVQVRGFFYRLSYFVFVWLFF